MSAKTHLLVNDETSYANKIQLDRLCIFNGQNFVLLKYMDQLWTETQIKNWTLNRAQAG